MQELRPIFVGDIQGCADELEVVLARAEERFGQGFALWCVGDVVNRGPFSLRALSRVRELVDTGRGHMVLGNHELHLLRAAAGHCPLSQLDSIGEVLEAPDVEDWIEWLRRRPIAVIGEVAGQRFAMVHASVAPDWDLDELEERAARVHRRLGGATRYDAEAFLAGDPAEDPDLDTLLRVTTCRSVAPDGSWRSEPPDAAPPGHRAWHAEWSARRRDWGIVYGHWALQGLHVAEGLRGLDSGCVHHGRGRQGFLTAWLPQPEGTRPFSASDGNFWQIPARRAYYLRKDVPDKTQQNEKYD